jgi:Tol biopolymer transport system component
MKKRTNILFISFTIIQIIFLLFNLNAQQINFNKLSGPYLGQSLTGNTTEIFAPGIVSTENYNHASVTISPDGTEIYWACEDANIGHRVIWFSKRENNKWTKPKFLSFTSEFDGDCPMFSPDGKLLFFLSKRPLPSDNNKMRERIWYVKRNDSGWTEPIAIDAIINSKHIHWQVSVDNNLNLYFGSERFGTKGKDDVFYAEYKDGAYEKVISLSESINTGFHESTPFISPDGSFIVFSRSTYGDATMKSGLYISLKNDNNNWTKAEYLGDTFKKACCPFISPDKKFLFFKIASKQTFKNVYWISTDAIKQLKN